MSIILPSILAEWAKRKRLPCMTDEDVLAVYEEHVPSGDQSCGCDGSMDDGCPWCTTERLREWQRDRVFRRCGLKTMGEAR